MRLMIFVLLSLLSICCSTKICTDTASVNRNVYKRYLIILKDSERPRKLVMPKEVKEGITFLETVSGVKSRAEINDNVSYLNKSDFNADIKQWEKWFIENKCKLTLHYVDSAFSSLGLTR